MLVAEICGVTRFPGMIKPTNLRDVFEPSDSIDPLEPISRVSLRPGNINNMKQDLENRENGFFRAIRSLPS